MERYRSVLVIADRGERCASRLRIAARIAADCSARLAALYAHSGPLDYMVSGAGERVTAMVSAVATGRIAEAAAQDEAMFHALATEYGLQSSWEIARDDALEALRLAARYCDLVVIGQQKKGAEQNTGIASDFCEELILTAGRPVLVVPEAGEFASVGKRILVAWDESREATRAIADALPLLARAEAVEVDVYGSAGPGIAEISENMARYLATHGARATVARHEIRQPDLRAQILARAAEFGADLIVMGAYGRPRLTEMMFGGVTRSMLKSAPLPVLMSH